jgi:phage tail protein X
MQTVIAHKNETVDALVNRITGSSDAVEQVYQLNQNLADLGTHLPHGTKVKLPDAVKAKTKTIKRQTLW